MEQRFKSLYLFEFRKWFSTKENCISYLAELNWVNGFRCNKCGHGNSCKGVPPASWHCTSCNYREYPTSNTLFHLVRFDIVKYFYIVYFAATKKRGITSTELSRKLDLRQKKCWAFKGKVMKVMKSLGDRYIDFTIEVDLTVLGGQEEREQKALSSWYIEKEEGRVEALCKSEIQCQYESLGNFMKHHIAAEAILTTNQWTGYRLLAKVFENLIPVPSGKTGIYFTELYRTIINLKGWLREIHHYVWDLQDYLEEHCYKFNLSIMKEGIFDSLMLRLVNTAPCFIKTSVTKRLRASNNNNLI